MQTNAMHALLTAYFGFMNIKSTRKKIPVESELKISKLYT